MLYIVLLLLYRKDFEGLEDSKNPVLPLTSLTLVLHKHGLVSSKPAGR